MPDTLHLTPAEAAYVMEAPIKAVKKMLDEGPIRASIQRRAGGSVRTIDRTDLVYLVAIRHMREELTPKARGELYEALKRSAATRARSVRFGRLHVDISDAVDEVERRVGRLEKLQDRVEFRDDGEPLIKGTSIEVHRIAALLAGDLTVEDILEDYPSLTRAQVEAAAAYAKAHPKPGRPYPRTTLKRAIGAGGAARICDVIGSRAKRRTD